MSAFMPSASCSEWSPWSRPSGPRCAIPSELGTPSSVTITACVAVVCPQRVQVAGVRVDDSVAGSLVRLVLGGQPQEVRVVRIRVVAGEEPAGPRVGRGDVGRVDRHEILVGQRLVRMVERVERSASS